uniref:JHL10I11.3 protein n=1 Tax=Rhizophora mucronata TaxID=61149 RepID=A0A2P2JMR2_RHIMU
MDSRIKCSASCKYDFKISHGTSNNSTGMVIYQCQNSYPSKRRHLARTFFYKIKSHKETQETPHSKGGCTSQSSHEGMLKSYYCVLKTRSSSSKDIVDLLVKGLCPKPCCVNVQVMTLVLVSYCSCTFHDCLKQRSTDNL